MSVAYDIANYLQTHGVGTVGTDIFVGVMPASPADVVTLYDYGGEPSFLHWGGEEARVQVVARSASYLTAEAKVRSLYEMLHGLAETTVGTRRVLLVQALQPPFLLTRDDQGRSLVACNFRILRDR